MSSALFNICLFRWTTRTATWRFRLEWNREEMSRSWHRIGNTPLHWTWFAVDREAGEQ